MRLERNAGKHLLNTADSLIESERKQFGLIHSHTTNGRFFLQIIAAQHRRGLRII